MMWGRLLPPFAAVLLAAATAPTRPLPIPPIPPLHRSVDGPAPVPDPDATAPRLPQTADPTITPRLLRLPTYQNTFDPSQGYLNGSRVEEDPTDRRLVPSPGVALTIPIK
jgi:hypothetical protein